MYDAVADLPLTVEYCTFELRERATSGGFDRATTTIALSDGGETGRGEDVTYTTAAHEGLVDYDVRVLDLKGLYDDERVANEPDPEFYRRVVGAVPNALVEDPNLTDATRPVFDGREARVTWDVPITGVDSIQALASRCYSDGPNDVAPGGYNDPDAAADLPVTPLQPPASTAGIDSGFGMP